MKMLALIALAVAAPASAQTPPPLTGVWSIGQTRNCTAGPAWALLADGIYAARAWLPAGNAPIVAHR